MKYEAVKGGLRVEKQAAGWTVVHDESSLRAAQYLRQRRFAEQARTELLSTGVDFTAPVEVLQSSAIRQVWQDVYYRWRGRTDCKAYGHLDQATFEYYPEHTRYGQFIPSAKQAAEMRVLAGMLRAAGRTPVGKVALEVTGTYVNEFAAMGLIMREDDEILWTGAKA